MNEIALGDWGRILHGQSSWWFVAEAVVRLLFLYCLLILALRLMGRRMSSTLSRNEMLALVSLAAAMGPPMQSPNQGLLPPLIIAGWVVALQRLMTFVTFRSHRFEDLSDGKVSALVNDGRVDLRELHRCSLPVERLRAQLRGEGLLNLGQVEHSFFEPGGAFSTVPAEQERPGLSLVPAWDAEMRATQAVVPAQCACAACGSVVAASEARGLCIQCGTGRTWEPAVCGRSNNRSAE